MGIVDSGCFLVRGVRRMPPSARHQVQVLLSMRGTPARLAHGGPTEPRGVVETATATCGTKQVERGGGRATDKSRGGRAQNETTETMRSSDRTNNTGRSNPPSSIKFQCHRVDGW